MDRLCDCDPGKRQRLFAERQIDLRDMAAIFADDRRLDITDLRRDYGETRRITTGLVAGRVFTVAYTIRGEVTWLITAWPASRPERARYARS